MMVPEEGRKPGSEADAGQLPSLESLRKFVVVAEEASFTRAAQRVHISQSGVSAQIRQLEHDLGAPLFDRSGRVARLTAAGTAALRPARAALAAAAAVRQAVDEVNGLLRGRLVVGMVTGCTVTPLFEALAAFHQAHPGVELSLLEGGSDVLTGQVRSGLADLALIGAAGAPPGGLESLTAVSEPLAAGLPPGHPLAGRGRVRLAEVAAGPVVTLPPGTGVRAVLDRSAQAAGVDLEVTLQASAPGAVADLARRGLGVAVLSRSMLAGCPGLGLAEIEDLAMPALLALVWAPGPGPALRELLVAACRAFGPPH
jgi:DNA-binding transcriptional LysR family regulator